MDDELQSSNPHLRSPAGPDTVPPASPSKAGVYERPQGAGRRRTRTGLIVGILIAIAILVALFAL